METSEGCQSAGIQASLWINAHIHLTKFFDTFCMRAVQSGQEDPNMGKIYKAALVLLYLLQLLIVFHEQISHFFEGALAPAHNSTTTDDQRSGLIKKLRQAMERHHAADVVLQAKERHDRLAAIRPAEHDPGHETHSEEKNRNDRGAKRRPIREFLIANLFPFFKKKRPQAAFRGSASGMTTDRFILFPSDKAAPSCQA
jgi:hypothetical protein